MEWCQGCECLQNDRDLIFKFTGTNIKKNLLNLGVVLVETDKLKTKLPKCCKISSINVNFS